MIFNCTIRRSFLSWTYSNISFIYIFDNEKSKHFSVPLRPMNVTSLQISIFPDLQSNKLNNGSSLTDLFIHPAESFKTKSLIFYFLNTCPSYNLNKFSITSISLNSRKILITKNNYQLIINFCIS